MVLTWCWFKEAQTISRSGILLRDFSSNDAKKRSLFFSFSVFSCFSSDAGLWCRDGKTTWEDLELDDIDLRLKWSGLFHRRKRTPGFFMMRLKVWQALHSYINTGAQHVTNCNRPKKQNAWLSVIPPCTLAPVVDWHYECHNDRHMHQDILLTSRPF